MHTTFVRCPPLAAPADGSAIRTSASAPQTTTPIRLIPLTSSSPALRSELLLADVRRVAPPSLIISLARAFAGQAVEQFGEPLRVLRHREVATGDLDRIRTDLASDEALPF